jgi:hypothetical protein
VDLHIAVGLSFSVALLVSLLWTHERIISEWHSSHFPKPIKNATIRFALWSDHKMVNMQSPREYWEYHRNFDTFASPCLV